MIFAGVITNWQDPMISDLNPSFSFPNQTITVVVRAEGSGTTSIFTTALSYFDPVLFPNATTLFPTPLPPNFITAHGNNGVFYIVGNTPYSVGYVALSAVTDPANPGAVGYLSYNGKVISPSSANFQAAQETAVTISDWTSSNTIGIYLQLAPSDSSWPIIG